MKDYEFHKGKSEYEHVLQANNKPSTETARGHQAPAAYLIMASGLDKVYLLFCSLKIAFKKFFFFKFKSMDLAPKNHYHTHTLILLAAPDFHQIFQKVFIFSTPLHTNTNFILKLLSNSFNIIRTKICHTKNFIKRI